MPSSRADIPLKVVLEGLGLAEKDLDKFGRVFSKQVLEKLDKMSGTDYFSKFRGNFQDLLELFKTAGISFQTVGRNITLSMKNTEGLINSVTAKIGDLNNALRTTPTGGAYAKKGTFEVTSESQSYLNKGVEQELITVQREIIAHQKEINNLMLQGDTSSGYYKKMIDDLEHWEGRLRDLLVGHQELADGSEASLSRVYRHYENEKDVLEELFQKKQQEKALADQQKVEEQNLRNYVSILKQRLSAEEELVRLQKQYGVNPNQSQKAALATAKANVEALRQQENQLKRNVSGTQAYEAEKQKIINLENQHKLAIQKLNVEGKKSNSIFGNFTQIFKTVVQSGASWMIFAKLRQSLREVVDTVVELDKSLVDLQIVTGKSRQGAQELLNTYNQMAKELGTTTKAVADSATTWLNKIGLLYSNI